VKPISRDGGGIEHRGMARFRPSQAFSPTEHHEWATKMWRRMDRDMSGKINRSELDCEEFRSVIRSVVAPDAGFAMGGAQYARAEMNMDQAINFCLRKADLNYDNGLTFEEFKSFMKCLRLDGSNDTASMVFALFDLDGDHRLDESEFREMYRFYLGHKPTEVEFQEEWGRLDTEGSQEVTKAEYMRWLRTSANPIFKQHQPTYEPQEPGDPTLKRASSSGRLPLLRKSGSRVRPLWNHRMNVAKPERCPVQQRTYFSRPQSLPELTRHYEKHRGFSKHRWRIAQEEPPKYRSPLSTDLGPQFLPQRALPGGKMRNPATGQRERWEDHWQTPLCVRPRIKPGTLLLQCSEPPPSWMLDYKGDNDALTTESSPPVTASDSLVPLTLPAATQVSRASITPSELQAVTGLPLHAADSGAIADAGGARGAPPAHALGPAAASEGGGLALHRGSGQLGRELLVLEAPGAGQTVASAARLIATLEQCLCDLVLVGGVAGLVVTCEVVEGCVGLGAMIVQVLVQRGVVGHERWRSVVVCGTEAGAEGPDEVEFFKITAADAFFGGVSGHCGPVITVKNNDSLPLIVAIGELPSTRIRYERPDANELAELLAPELGVDKSGFAREIMAMRMRVAAEARQLETLMWEALETGELRGLQAGGQIDERMGILRHVVEERASDDVAADCAIA